MSNRKPNLVKMSQQRTVKPKKVPRETIGEPRPTFVYRKDAFKKVKIT
jgi:hypothetical protein